MPQLKELIKIKLERTKVESQMSNFREQELGHSQLRSEIPSGSVLLVLLREMCTVLGMELPAAYVGQTSYPLITYNDPLFLFPRAELWGPIAAQIFQQC